MKFAIFFGFLSQKRIHAPGIDLKIKYDSVTGRGYFEANKTKHRKTSRQDNFLEYFRKYARLEHI